MRFGQGLTYSTLAMACAASESDSSHDELTISCNVTSTSGTDGDQVLLIFHRASPDVVARVGGAHPIPLSTLVHFDRIVVPAGAMVPVSWHLSVSRSCALVDETGARVLYPGAHLLDVWDGSTNNVTLTVEVAGGTPRTIRAPPRV